MSVIPIRSAATRGARMLRTALGPEIGAWLEDLAVIEVMLNPDGCLLAGSGLGLPIRARCCPPPMVSGSSALSRTAQPALRYRGAPRVSAEFAPGRGSGSRAFAACRGSAQLRDPQASRCGVHSGGLCQAGIMPAVSADAFAAAARRGAGQYPRRGRTSTGKTTLTNALLAEVALTGDRC